MNQSTICPNCYETYNLTNRCPAFLPTCEHTLCSDCLKKLINQSEELKCPIDKGILSVSDCVKSLDYCLLTYIFLTMFESKQDKNLCPIHNEELKFICMTEKKKVCNICMGEDQHQNHDLIYIKSKFVFEVTDTSSSSKKLNISISPTLKSINVDLEKLANVQIVRLEFNEQRIDDKDIAILSYIWRRIDGPTSLQIKIYPNSIVDCYKDVCKALLEGSKGYTSVVIDLAGYQLLNKDLVQYLVDDLLSRMTYLKEIRLILNDINLKSRSQGGLFQGIHLNAANLEYFSLKLSNSNIVDEDIAPIFVAMPNIRKYFLDLEYTKVTDITLNNYVQNTMPYRNNLEIYVMNLGRTKVTHVGLKDLFTIPITVKHFQLLIADTEANDQTVNCMLESIKNSFNIFEIFSVNFSYCRMISESALCQMFQQMSKVRTYTIGLSNTQVTDASLVQFAQRSLSTMKALENFAISLDQTAVTDIGVDDIISDLGPNIKQLVISLHHTAVTNKSIEPFVKTTLAEMKSLKGFKMKVTETGVSAEIKAEIESLEKTIKDKMASH